MKPATLALVTCLTLLVIGIMVGRATARPRGESFDPDDFDEIEPPRRRHPPSQPPPPQPSSEPDPEMLLQMHMEKESAPYSKTDQPEERLHMVGRGVTHQTMVPMRAVHASGAWGNSTGMSS